MSFYEDKSAEILSKIQGVKCLILSTALKKVKKIYKELMELNIYVFQTTTQKLLTKNFQIYYVILLMIVLKTI